MRGKLLFAILAIMCMMGLGTYVTGALAYFSDSEASTGSSSTLWTSALWTQTSQADFDAGVLSNVDTSPSPGDAKLSIVPNPTLVVSNNTEVYTDTSSSGFQWVKTLTFTKSGSSYNELRIDSNLRVSDIAYTAQSSIRVDDVEKFTHSTASTTYVNYSDTIDFTSYPDGSHTVKLYMTVNGGSAYNTTFAVYRTSPVLVTSNNTEVFATGNINWQLKKTLTFTKSGSDYNNLRIDSNLRATDHTAYSSIRVDDVELFTHSTVSTTYVNYGDVLDFSSYPDGSHTIKLYLKIGNKTQSAYNSTFELWRTSPVLITSDNTEISITSTPEYQIMKILNLTKDGPTYNELRIDSNLRSAGSTAYSSVRVDGVEKFTHTTTSTTYVSYSDVLDFSAYADGPHTVKLYMKSLNKNQAAYNSLFEVYRTKTYAASGTLASQVLDTTVSGSRWDAVFWNEVLQTNTDITFEVRASDTAFLKDAATPTWTSVGGTSPVLSGLPAGRYKQWRATFAPDTVRAKTPTLQEVRLYYYGP